MRTRFCAVSFAALAFPPFTPPFLRATVNALSGPFGESFATSPVLMSTISLASWLGSRGRFGRLAMA
jgi:hypothetical protein